MSAEAGLVVDVDHAEVWRGRGVVVARLVDEARLK